MFTAALFTTAKTWKQPKSPSTDEWIHKMWYICTVEYYSPIKRTIYIYNGILLTHKKEWYTYTMVYYSPIKKTEIMTFAATRILK